MLIYHTYGTLYHNANQYTAYSLRKACYKKKRKNCQLREQCVTGDEFYLYSFILMAFCKPRADRGSMFKL